MLYVGLSVHVSSLKNFTSRRWSDSHSGGGGVSRCVCISNCTELKRPPYCSGALF